MGRIVPIIMCGGTGTRLWPASRESMPKQFIPLSGGLSTFQQAALRVSQHALFARPVAIANAEARFLVAEQLAQIGVTADIILEPERRDSAAAVAVAALHVARHDAGSLVLVLAADHLVSSAEAFAETCRLAAVGAEAGYIMTIGIAPQNPSPAYGYIQPGEAIAGTGVRKVARFVEKPAVEAAAACIAAGCDWNSGNFLFRASVMLAELDRLAPAVLEAARSAHDGAVADLDFIRLDGEAFGRAPKLSIDYAVMERSRQVACVRGGFGWSDIGTWDALWDALPKDGEGNVKSGNVVSIGTGNSLIQSNAILTAVVGLEDVVVVAEADAVLVMARSQAGLVRELVAGLALRGRPEATRHVRLYRPWGWHQRVDIGPRFQVKRLVVKPGGRLSLQRHHHRAEHWVVVHGTAEVTIDDRTEIVYENGAVYLPIGCLHRLANPGRVPLEIIEVQVGSYTGEDDIVRVDDVYGRS